MFPNSKIKDDIQKLKLKLSKDKPAVSMIEKDGPIADSPVAIDFEETHPGGSPQDNLPDITPPEHKTPCETPCCKHCGRGLGIYPEDVLPNNDNPFSGL